MNYGAELSIAPLTPIEKYKPFDESAPDLAALKEAHARAVEARIAAESALRQAEAAEAEIATRENDAILAAIAIKRDRLLEASALAASQEAQAMEKVSAYTAELQRIKVVKTDFQLALDAIALSRDETQRTLDRLSASLAEQQDQFRAAEIRERHLEEEVAKTQREADELSRARERAVLAVEAMMRSSTDECVSIAPKADMTADAVARPHLISESITGFAERAAERRAADAARRAMKQ